MAVRGRECGQPARARRKMMPVVRRLDGPHICRFTHTPSALPRGRTGTSIRTCAFEAHASAFPPAGLVFVFAPSRCLAGGCGPWWCRCMRSRVSASYLPWWRSNLARRGCMRPYLARRYPLFSSRYNVDLAALVPGRGVEPRSRRTGLAVMGFPTPRPLRSSSLRHRSPHQARVEPVDAGDRQDLDERRHRRACARSKSRYMPIG